jgi:uncharacterized repeat protein (TIGR04052 family)
MRSSFQRPIDTMRVVSTFGFSLAACGGDAVSTGDKHNAVTAPDAAAGKRAAHDSAGAAAGGSASTKSGAAGRGGAGGNETDEAGGSGDEESVATAGAGGAGAAGGKAGGGSKGGASGKSGAGGKSAGAGGAGAPAAQHAGAGGLQSAAGSEAGSGGQTAGGTDEEPVTIRFKAVVGDADLACGQEYAGVGSAGTTVTPQDFRMFVQDLALLRADGSRVPVKFAVRTPWQAQAPDVALLDFEDNTGRCSEGTPETNMEITGTAPAGEYTGISFGNGVPEELNHADPVTLPDPLKTHASLSWGWLTGFRFMKAEVVQVVAEGETFGTGLVHPGSMGCAKADTEITCTKPNRNQITLMGFDPSKDTVLIDLAAIFAQVNLTEDAQCHGSGSACAPTFDALGIDFASGQPKDGQTVFRRQAPKQ